MCTNVMRCREKCRAIRGNAQIAGILGGLVAAVSAVAAADANAPVMHYTGQSQVRGAARRSLIAAMMPGLHVFLAELIDDAGNCRPVSYLCVHCSCCHQSVSTYSSHAARQAARPVLLCVQALHQLMGLGATLVLAILGGLLFGLAVKHSDCARQKMGEEHFFEDAVFWHEVVDEEGELGHTVANGEA